jgi:hypothetical protein
MFISQTTGPTTLTPARYLYLRANPRDERLVLVDGNCQPLLRRRGLQGWIATRSEVSSSGWKNLSKKGLKVGRMINFPTRGGSEGGGFYLPLPSNIRLGYTLLKLTDTSLIRVGLYYWGLYYKTFYAAIVAVS